MALQKQTYRVNMGQGLDTKTDPKVLSSGKMVVLQNAKFSSTNRLSKRDGFAAVGVVDSSGASIQRLDNFRGQIIGWGDPPAVTGIFYPGTSYNGTITPRSVFTYNQSITTPTFKTSAIPAFNDCLLASQPVGMQSQYGFSQSDSASTNGFTLFVGTAAFEAQGQGIVFTKIVNQLTGQIVIAPNVITGEVNGSAVRCVASGNVLLLGYIDTSANTLNIVSYDTANAFATTAIAYTGMLAGSTQWDWAPYVISGPSNAIVAGYQVSATQIRFVKMSSTGVNTASLTYATSVTVICFGMVQPVPSTVSTTFRAIFSDSSKNMHCVPLSTALVAGTATAGSDGSNISTPVIVTGQEGTNGDFWTFVGTASSVTAPVNPGNFQIVPYVTNTSGTWGANRVPINTLAIHSKPIYRNDNNVYLWSYFPSPSGAQGQYVLLHSIPYSPPATGVNFLAALYPAARILAGQAMSTTQGGATVVACNTAYLGSNNYQHSAIVIGAEHTQVGGFVQIGSIASLQSDFNFINAFATSTINNQTIVTGGLNAIYDGTSITELGFLQWPEPLSASVTSTTGSLSAGLYQYIAIYEWTDKNGNLHRSETSIPLSATTSGTTNNAITVTIPSLGCTLKGQSFVYSAPATIALYRTTVNANPLIFYRVVGGLAGAGTYQDKTADTGITASEILYIQGGVEDNFTIDGTSVICAGPDRLYAADPNDNGIIHVGIPYVETNGLAFFSGITIQIPTIDGAVTNMLFMDSSLVIFKARSIYVVQGQGPTANGQNNGLSPAQKVTGDVGCDNPHAATLYPDGILFKSAKGYYRLGRDLSFAADSNYIGSGVEAFNSLSCLRAMLREDRNEARFLLSDNATILVYNYFFNQWSSIITSATDMTEVNGAFYVSSATPSVGGLVAQETLGTFTDALTSPTGIPFTITLGWIALNQLQGCQRVYRVRFLGDFKSTHTLKVEFAYDYESSFNETHTITSANITTGGSAYQCEAFPLRQKCEAIQIRISDPSPTGESFDLTDIELEVGILPGRRFPLAAQKGF